MLSLHITQYTAKADSKPDTMCIKPQTISATLKKLVRSSEETCCPKQTNEVATTAEDVAVNTADKTKRLSTYGHQKSNAK